MPVAVQERQENPDQTIPKMTKSAFAAIMRASN